MNQSNHLSNMMFSRSRSGPAGFSLDDISRYVPLGTCHTCALLSRLWRARRQIFSRRALPWGHCLL